MTVSAALWCGIGIGLAIADGLEWGPPRTPLEVLNWMFAPVFWPLAVWRRLNP